MEVLTHTKRRDFLNCPRYYYLRHERHLQPIMQKGGRRRGSAFGHAIFAAAQSPDDTFHVVSKAIQEAYQPAFAAISKQEEYDELALEVEKLLPVTMGYIKRYGLEKRREIVYDQPLVNPETRKPSRTFRRGGKIDGLRKISDYEWIVVEDKLVGQIQQAMIDRLPLDAQASEYVDALVSLGFNAMVEYRHTLFPQSKPKLIGTGEARRRETLDEYADRLAADIEERPEHYYDQQTLHFPTDRLQDFRRGRWGTARKIMDARLEEKRLGWQTAFPMNPSRCWEYGGCEFIPLCTRGEDAIDLYEVVADNPELEREEYDGTAAE